MGVGGGRGRWDKVGVGLGGSRWGMGNPTMNKEGWT